MVLIHASGPAYHRFHPQPGWEWWFANGINGSCRAAVPVFAMITGALLREEDCDARRFYRRKTLRFLPVLLAWSLAYAVFDLAVLGLSPREILHKLISSGNVYLHLWYLTMFWGLLAVSPLVAQLKFSTAPAKRDLALLLGVSITLVAADWTCQFFSNSLGLRFDYWTRTFVEFIPYLMAGALLTKLDPPKRPGLYLLALTAALLAGWVANYLACQRLGIIADHMPLGNESPLVFAVAISVFLVFRTRRTCGLASNRAMTLLGNATLGVYLVHPFFLWFAGRICRGREFDPFASGWIPATALAVFLLSAASAFALRAFPWGRKIC